MIGSGYVDRFGPPQSVNQGPDDSGDDGDYDAEMSADQRMAMKELQEMKLDLAYAGQACVCFYVGTSDTIIVKARSILT